MTEQYSYQRTSKRNHGRSKAKAIAISRRDADSLRAAYIMGSFALLSLLLLGAGRLIGP